MLLPDYRFHKVLWINGEGRNGKGVFDRTIQGILGRENFSSVGLEELDGNHRFALNRLYGKLYNTSSEPATNHFFKTEIFQKLSGGDPIDAERKGKDETLKFVNCAKLTIIGNKFPKIRNPTTAFKERMMFIKFPNFIGTKDRIPNLERVWLGNPEEKSAILNWKLEGLHRLLTQGYFTESKTQQKTEIEFQKTSDTIGAFLTEMAVFDKRIVTTRSEAFEKYKDYCEVFGLESENEKVFTARLKETPKITVSTVSKPKRERAWKGLGLKQLDDEGIVTAITDVTGQIPLTLSENLKNSKDISHVTSVPSVTEGTFPNRYCQDECANFDKPTCTAPNWKALNQNSLLPMQCPGYAYVGAVDEESS